MTMALNRSKKRKNDPTGQSSRRRKATRSLDTRLNQAEKRIKPLIRDLQPERRVVTPVRNNETIVYEYHMSPAEILALEAQIRTIINEELGTIGDSVEPDWFWSDQIEPPYREGTVEEINRTNQLISAALIAGLIPQDGFIQPVAVESVIFSRDAFQVPLNNLIAQNYSTIKSLSDRTAAQVIQEINSGINAGLSRSDIIDLIEERFDVSRSNAKRIADTEINRAYNDGKLNATEQIGRRTGVRTAVLHISALLPTTRDTHADRHGKAYTVEDQLRWWNSGVNRINCKCSTNSVLIDNRGNIIQTQDQETLEQERRFFEQEDFDFEN